MLADSHIQVLPLIMPVSGSSSLVNPVPAFSTEGVSLEPGRNFAIVTVEPGRARPYMVDGRALERRGDQLGPITRQRITEPITDSTEDGAALQRAAAAIETMSEVVERLQWRLHWKRELPLQLALLIAGAVLGYLLGVWNPLKYARDCSTRTDHGA